MINFNREYWENRGKRKYYYRGEDFYTISPIPYYYQRRKVLLNLLGKEISEYSEQSHNITVLDFGCGDGFYSIYTRNLLSNCSVWGYDVAHSMIKRAKKKRGSAHKRKITFSAKFPAHTKFDIIYIFAVFAHLTDKQIKYVLEVLSNRLTYSGKILLFEATGIESFSGSKWFRRTEQDYIELFNKNNLKLHHKNTIIFPFYNKCRYRIIKPIGKLFFSSDILMANNSILFRWFNELLLFLSQFLDKFFKDHDGNTFFVFNKNFEMQRQK